MPLISRAGVAFGLAVVAYLPFMSLPLISDDYVQIYLGRLYGAIAGWPDLASDVLYRSRATSLVLTNVIDSLAGADPTAHRLVNAMLHVASVAVVAMLGLWRAIGWRISIPAACFFAVHEGHQEAVVWSAAMPELLVFVFGTASVLLFLHRHDHWAFAAFVLALLSKESAVVVVPLAMIVWWMERRRERGALLWLAGMAIVSAVYAWGIFAASASHLHLNDGTFSLSAPFWKVIPISIFRLLWVWGLVALALLAWQRTEGRLVALAFAWMVVTLLPYAFLLYMDRVPSRHTYWASAGLALLVGAAYAVCRERWRSPRAAVAVTVLAAGVVAQNLGYLWTKKMDQYQRRAALTERFLKEAARHDRPIHVRCGAYGLDVYRFAANIRLGSPVSRVSDTETAGAVDYCDPEHP